MPRKVDDVESIKRFNLARQILKLRPFSVTEMAEHFRKSKIPYPNYMKVYVQFNVLQVLPNNKVCFPEEPVYIEKWTNALNYIRSLRDTKSSKAEEELLQKEQECISFLKERGFLIFKKM